MQRRSTMRKWIVAVAAAVSACSSAPRQETRPATGKAIATFTVKVDSVAGTIGIHSEPATVGNAAGVAALVIEPAGVLVQNNAAGPWFNESTEHGCGLIPTWGSRVTITNLFPSSYLSGVYARITDFNGGTGNEACNPEPSPTGFSAGLGIWSYGLVGTTSIEKSWTFNYVSAARFTFHGEILGAKMTNFSTGSSPIRGQLKANGTNTVFPTEGGIGFIEPNGTVTSTGGSPGTIPDTVVALATDAGHGRIWYAALLGHVGYTDGLGGNVATQTWLWNASDMGFDIAQDAVSADLAWLLTTDFSANGALRSVSTGTPPTLGSAGTFAGRPGGMATAGTNIYVTNTTNSTIDVWTAATPVADAPTRGVPIDTASAGCGSPGQILWINGNLWFTAASAICKMTLAGVVTKVADAASPTGMCSGSDGNIWYIRPDAMVRVIPGEVTPWSVEPSPQFQGGTQPSCTSGSGGFWMATNFGQTQITRVEP
jgi:hypothetical protein